MPTTPNMGMTLPVVSSTPGPLYASENNQAFSVIDSHNHSPGNGAPVPTAGISINADLQMNGFNLGSIRSSQYSSQSAPLSLPSDIRSVYVVGGDLYYNNGIGQSIQITAGAALNATTIGGIGGDYATSTASEFYTSLTSTFTFWSAVHIPAAIDSGPITLRTISLSPFGITINSPPALSADYSLTLPGSLPASTKILTLDNAGNIAAVYDVDNSTIVVSSNTIQVPAGGITTTQIAANTIVNGNIADNTIKAIKLASNLRTTSVFTTSGTYVVPDDVTSVRIIACGGGGAGGHGGATPSSNAGGGGGGGGSPIYEGVFDVTPGSSIPVTIGTGGTATAGTGNTGGSTSFGSLITIPGGSGGVAGNSGGSGGVGGTTGFGTHNGGPGNTGFNSGTNTSSGGVNYLSAFSAVAATGGTGGTGGGGAGGGGGSGGGSIGAGGDGAGGAFSNGFPGGIGAGGGGGVGGTGGGTAGAGGDGYLAVYVL